MYLLEYIMDGYRMDERLNRKLRDTIRDCRPSAVPLKNSYYHGVCDEPLSGATIADILTDAAASDPDHVVFKVPEFNQSITLGRLKQRVDTLAKAFLGYGLQKGDIVTLTGVVDIEFYSLLFAITQIGAVFYYPTLEDPEERDTERMCALNPALVCVGRATANGSIPALKRYAERRQNAVGTQSTKLVLLDVNGGTQTEELPTIKYADFLSTATQTDEDTLDKNMASVGIDDTAVIFGSSGTVSGQNKLSALTHHFLVNIAIFTHHRVAPWNEPELISHLTPLREDICTVLQAVRIVKNGESGVMAPTAVSTNAQDVQAFMEFIETEKVTWHGGLPFEFIHAVKSPKFTDYDMGSLRGGNLISQVVSVDIKKILLRHFPDMLNLFGSSEALCGVATSAAWSTPEQRLNSIGYPYAHCELKLVDERGHVVPVGSQGEICVRGWTVFKEYVMDSELTAKVKDTSNCGWYHYGDIGVMDETGHVFYVGRKTDCVRFKHKGDAVYPSHILRIVEGCPKVKAATVIGVPCDEKGDDVCLCIELVNGCSIDQTELKEMLEAELFVNECPDYYFIFDQLPRTGGRNKIAVSKLKSEVEKRLQAIQENGQKKE